LLLEKYGANVNCTENEGFTPLMAACANGHLPIVQYLVFENNETKILMKNENLQTALHRAAYYGQTEILHFLLTNTKLSITTEDSCGNNCLLLACMKL